MAKFINFFTANKKHFFLLGIILLVSAFLRLYKIADYVHFLGDEGRDVLVVKRIIVDHQFTLLGPITSVGSMYLGPIYYYFMVPFLYLFQMDPVGPAVMIVLFSLLTIVLIYFTGIEFFDIDTALIGCILYSLSPLVIVYSRFSWNPNAVPFFAMLIIYGLLKLILQKKTYWSFIIGLSLGVVLQLHYLALVFIPLIFLTLILNKRLNLSIIGKIILGALITFSPYLIFEIRHGFPNIQTMLRFMTAKGGASTFALSKFPLTVVDVTTRAFWRIVVIESNLVSKLLILLVILSLVFIYKSKKVYSYKKALNILLLWFIVVICAFGLYQGAIYDYYMVVFFPLPALLTAIVFSWYLKKGLIFKILTIGFLGLLIFYQVKNSPLFKEPNRLLVLTKDRARFIINLTGNKPYNFALITGSNSDHAYRYFLELWGEKPVTILNPVIDPQRDTVTGQLIIICETDKCQPLGNPLWEVAGFGQAEIENSWEVSGVKIYRLVPYKG